MALTATLILPSGSLRPLQHMSALNAFVLLSTGVFWMLFAVQHAPRSLYVYSAFPIYFWWRVISRTGGNIAAWKSFVDWTHLYAVISNVVLTVAALQAFVVRDLPMICPLSLSHTALQYGYGPGHRWIWSIGFFTIGVVWPLWSWPQDVLSQRRELVWQWSAACLLGAVFPLLPVPMVQHVPTMLVLSIIVADSGELTGALQRPRWFNDACRRAVRMLEAYDV